MFVVGLLLPLVPLMVAAEMALASVMTYWSRFQQPVELWRDSSPPRSRRVVDDAMGSEHESLRFLLVIPKEEASLELH